MAAVGSRREREGKDLIGRKYCDNDSWSRISSLFLLVQIIQDGEMGRYVGG